jgi:hypothetical protein
MKYLFIIAALSLTSINFSMAASTDTHPDKDQHREGPCRKIKEACLAAGFKQGDWKNGDGLWRDCIDPIIQGVSTVPGGTKTLPKVDPADIAACKAKKPKFGEGKVGSKSP